MSESTATATHVLHVDDGRGLSLCRIARIAAPRKCWRCIVRPDTEGPWVVCGDGKVQHLEQRLDSCRATRSVPFECKVCARKRDAREADRRAAEHRRLTRAERERREQARRRWPDDWGKLPAEAPGARNVYAGQENR